MNIKVPALNSALSDFTPKAFSHVKRCKCFLHPTCGALLIALDVNAPTTKKKKAKKETKLTATRDWLVKREMISYGFG